MAYRKSFVVGQSENMGALYKGAQGIMGFFWGLFGWNTPEVPNKTLLELAQEKEVTHEDFAKCLQENISQINNTGKRGNTALHYLIMNWNQRIKEGDETREINRCVRSLILQAAADVNIINHEGLTPIAVAAIGTLPEYSETSSQVAIRYSQTQRLGTQVPNQNTDVNSDAVEMLEKECYKDLLIDFDLGENVLNIRNELKKLGFSTDRIQERNPNDSHLKIFTYFSYILRNPDFEQQFCDEIEHSPSFIAKNDGFTTLLQRACIKDRDEAVRKLLQLGADPYETTSYCVTTPIGIICVKGKVDILEYMLELNNKVKADPRTGQTPLHELAMKADKWDPEHHQCLLTLLKKFNDPDLNLKDKQGLTALDYAVIFGSKEAIETIIKYGNNIVTSRNLKHRLVKNVPARSLEDYLNNQIFVSEKYDNHITYFNVTVNYSFLRPEKDKTSETETLMILAERKDTSHILTHPVIATFIEKKWHMLQKHYWINLTISLYLCVMLTMYTIRSPNASTGENTVVQVIIGFLLFLLIIREAIQIIDNICNYFSHFENYLEIPMILLGVYVVIEPHVDVGEDLQKILGPQISAALILIAWGDFLLLLGKHPNMAIKITILLKVCGNFLYQMGYVMPIVLAFATSFMIIFRNEENTPFPDFFNSLFKIAVMFAGEYNASDIPFSAQLALSYFIFVVFIFLMAVVLINLLNGLAASDIEKITKTSEVYVLKAMTAFIDLFERLNLAKPLFPEESGEKKWEKTFQVDQKFLTHDLGKYTSCLIDYARRTKKLHKGRFTKETKNQKIQTQASTNIYADIAEIKKQLAEITDMIRDNQEKEFQECLS